MSRPVSPKLRNYLFRRDRQIEHDWEQRKLELERHNANLTPEQRQAQAVQDNLDLFGDVR